MPDETVKQPEEVGDKEEAIGIKRQDFPEEYEKKFNEAETAYSQGDIARAREILVELTTLYPNFDKGWYALSKVYFTEDKFSECAVAYKKCLKITPTFGMYNKLLPLSLDNPNKLFGIAKALYEEALYQESLKFTDRLVEMEIQPDLRNKAIVLREELHSIFEKERNEVAESFKKSERRIATFFTVLGITIVIGVVAIFYYFYAQSQKTPLIDKGKRAYNRAIQMLSDFSIKEKGADKAKLELEIARDTFSKVIEKEPANAEAHYWLAKTFMAFETVNANINKSAIGSRLPTDLTSDVESSLRRTIELDPNYAEAYLDLAQRMINQKKLDEAKTLLSQAIQKAEVRYPGDDLTNSANRKNIIDRANVILNKLEGKPIEEVQPTVTPSSAPSASPGNKPTGKEPNSPSPVSTVSTGGTPQNVLKITPSITPDSLEKTAPRLVPATDIPGKKGENR